MHRHQFNSIISTIDGSNVYGSEDETALFNRALKESLMKTSEVNLLPFHEAGFFMAGDVRANERVSLISMLTILVREHNRIAIRLKQFYPFLMGEKILVLARQTVIGIFQAIT